MTPRASKFCWKMNEFRLSAVRQRHLADERYLFTTETESIQAYHLFIFQQNFDALGDVFHGPPQNVKLGSGV